MATIKREVKSLSKKFVKDFRMILKKIDDFYVDWGIVLEIKEAKVKKKGRGLGSPYEEYSIFQAQNYTNDKQTKNN